MSSRVVFSEESLDNSLLKIKSFVQHVGEGVAALLTISVISIEVIFHDDYRKYVTATIELMCSSNTVAVEIFSGPMLNSYY